ELCVARCLSAGPEPRLVVRVQLCRMWSAIVMYDRRQRAARGFEASSHVPVSGGIARELRRREQRLEIRGRFDWVEPVALIDRRAFHDRPTSVSSLQAIEKAR